MQEFLEKCVVSYWRKKQKDWFLIFIFLSLFLHIGVLLPVFLKDSHSVKETSVDDHLVFIDDPFHQQVVTQKEFNQMEPAKPSRYLSEQDKAVEKEVQAVMKGLFHQARQASVNPAPTDLKKIQRQLSSLSEELSNTIEAPLKLELNESGKLSQTPDFLPGVESGSHTLLNTKEFTYYSFFVRMKEQLYWRWLKYFKRDHSASLISLAQERQRLFSTYLYAVLSSDGEMQDLMVVDSSGSEVADTAALHAFLSAAPFPNPPGGLVEADGFIHIRQSFHIYVGSSVAENSFSKHTEQL